MKNRVFFPADILLVKEKREKFAVVACDQFTSEPEYWESVREIIGDCPSAYKIILPEIYLADKDGVDGRIADINAEMDRYLGSDVFDEYKNAIIYIERRLRCGKIRRGIVGMIDLEAYDYHKGSKLPIRATEGTVLERIPPRVRIRRDASMELPHVMLLADDIENRLIGAAADNLEKNLYDFELMKDGGHIRGSLVSERGIEAIDAAIGAICEAEEEPFLFAVGDGNHSLATAKECWEQKKRNGEALSDNDPARFALVEIVNIHDEALEFEPIYRVVFGADPSELIAEMKAYFGGAAGDTKPQTFEYLSSEFSGSFTVKAPKYSLPVGSLQAFLDEYKAEHPEIEVDYIHGADTVRKLCKAGNTVGFLFDGMGKGELFDTIRADGVLPRKTFSMGEANDKRYYIEGRRIK